MTRGLDRLLHLGNVVVDIVLDVPGLPERGGDVLATGTVMTPGGGFNVMAAAARQGLPVAYAGALGSGPFADIARVALAAEGIEILGAPKPGTDTGFVVSLVEAGGERTFVTSSGAEATLTAADLGEIRATPRDAVYLSGYGLLQASNRAALLGWLDRLDGGNMVVADPGPLVQLVPSDVVEYVLGRADWWTCNAREAAWLTGCQDPVAAARALARRADSRLDGSRQDGSRQAGSRRYGAGPGDAGSGGSGHTGVLVRTGPAGCVLCCRGANPVHVQGFRVDAVDTSGAGDTHTGAFIAALAGGADEVDAARTANAAAALSVTRRGPATGPAAAELTRFLAGR
ncbi:MAG: PfkB family carbohydrate kinase [Streptosporangiaceae bacterium]|jgi:sugar/nucleoside kinase (ribokinase family)